MCEGGVFEMGKLVLGLLRTAATPGKPGKGGKEGKEGKKGILGKMGKGKKGGGGGGASCPAPTHDTLGVVGVAQGMAGTQRSFFNLLAAAGGAKVEGKAEQRAAIVAMQSRAVDAEVERIFVALGSWLAIFIVELQAYLPFPLTTVEAGGKLTDKASGEIMLAQARTVLSQRGVRHVRRAEESEFGQALAMAEVARGRHAPAGCW